jgi:hypothetical protein
MNENYCEMSDTRADFTACFLRRKDQSLPAAQPVALSDLPHSAPSVEPQFLDPERWDGQS